VASGVYTLPATSSSLPPPPLSCFVVPDPSSVRVGSGGATFNALLTLQELAGLGAGGIPVESSRIIMIHSGGDSQRLSCQSVTGKAWSTLPHYTCQSRADKETAMDLNAPIDLLLQQLLKMFANAPPGLIIASSDVLLSIPDDFTCEWPSHGAVGLAIPTDKALGPNHGVYQIPTDASSPRPSAPHEAVPFEVRRFWQKASVTELAAGGAVRPDGKVLLDTGVIYFSAPATTKLLDIARMYPLDCCSYLGVDMNRRPLRIELYSDIMMAMGGGMGLTRSQYHSTPSSEDMAGTTRLTTARDILWNELNSMEFYAVVVEDGGFSHVGTTAEYLQLLTQPTAFQQTYGLKHHAAFFEHGSPVLNTGASHSSNECVDDGAAKFTVMNSFLHSVGWKGEGTVVEHSELSGTWFVGSHALVSSLRSISDLVIRDGIAVQELRLEDGATRVVSVLQVN
jgi:hypothetical protein